MTNLDEVSGWIDAFLAGGASFGATATLRQCMEFGHSDMNLGVIDAAGTTHRIGDVLYETAFLIALRALVLDGIIEPVPDDEAQHIVWHSWMNTEPTDEAVRAQVLKIPLRRLPQPAEEPEAPQEERVGAYLLGILKAEGSVRFSRFYNDDTDYAKLAAEAGVDESQVDHAHILIEYAADDLKRLGIVTYTTLPDKLIDDENDYLIALTDKGRQVLANGEKVRFQYVDM